MIICQGSQIPQADHVFRTGTHFKCSYLDRSLPETASKPQSQKLDDNSDGCFGPGDKVSTTRNSTKDPKVDLVLS